MWKKLTKIFNAKELEDEVEETGTSSIKDKIQGILLAVFYIGGIMLFIFLLVDKLTSCERRSNNEWTTVNVHDCFYIDIPPMMEIVTGKVSTSGITRGIWDEESSYFQLNFVAKSMSETPDESPYAAAYISYDVNPFECEFGNEEEIDMPEEVVYSKIIEPLFSDTPNLHLVGTPSFVGREINGRNFYVVEFMRQVEDYPPSKTQYCFCRSTNGSTIVIEVACDSEEWMDDMMKIIETIEIP